MYLDPDYFEGDIILTPEERQNIYKPSTTFGASKRKWPGQQIAYDFAPDIGTCIQNYETIIKVLKLYKIF